MYCTYKSNILYREIKHDSDFATAEEYIDKIEKKRYISPLDSYRMGSVYDFILKDSKQAHKHYMKAISDVKSRPSSGGDIFIQTRLRDRIRINAIAEDDDNKYDIDEVDELYNEIMNLEIMFDHLSRSGERSHRPKSKKIEDKIEWTSDSQNVHDSNINNELKHGFKKITESNKDAFLWNISDIENYFNHVYTHEISDAETHNIKDSLKMLNYIKKKGASKIMKLGVSETNFISNVFTKMYCEEDAKKRKTMMENFLLNLADSYNKGSPVCITGRVTRVLTSFSDMDENNPTLGILKAKPVIRNEILMKAANIRNKIYENADREIKDKYDSGENDHDVRQLEDDMKANISAMIENDYSNIKEEDSKFISDIYAEIVESI